MSSEGLLIPTQDSDSGIAASSQIALDGDTLVHPHRPRVTTESFHILGCGMI